MSGDLRKMGVEEEFHLVDLRTRRLTPRSQELLAELPSDIYVEELQRCVIESNSAPAHRLVDLREGLRHSREVLVGAATDLGIGVVAAGSVPLSVPTELVITETARYRRMLADYQLLAREQLICGTQIHVDVADRDEAVSVCSRIARHTPVLLALSTSSPFWSDGSDTGYASARTLIWQRWPTSGPFPAVHTATDYDTEIGRLVDSGVISDPGMVYFDVRPSTRMPTIELRVCDSCPSVQTITLIAGIFRALVQKEAHRPAAHASAPVSPTLYRAAIWQAARSGLEGDLVDMTDARPRPAAAVVTDLVTSLRPELEANGDWPLIDELLGEAIGLGSSSARQRRVLRRHGRLADVVDRLVAETAGHLAPVPAADDPQHTLLHGYQPDDDTAETAVDEAIAPEAAVRENYRPALAAIASMGAAVIRRRQFAIEREQSVDGVTFKVSGQTRAQVFPLDVVPRIVEADSWARVGVGLRQRALALNAFLTDIYTDAAIVNDRVIPSEVLDRAPGYRGSGRRPRWQRVRTHICGTDLISTAPGDFIALEDNLRVPSGIGYALSCRALSDQFLPEIPRPSGLLPIDGIPQMIAETIAMAAPPYAADDGVNIVLSSGWDDSAWFEHTMIALRSGLCLARPEQLSVADGRLHLWRGRTPSPVNVAYVRMDEDMLLSSTGIDDAPLREGILAALTDGTLALANALGNGVGDDKAVYAYVPTMIRYYLGEEPALAQVPTWLCAERDQRDHVLAHLGEMVVKPIDGLGGSGITVGPEASEADLDRRRVELATHPERFVAQEVISLSTHPTFDGRGLFPHHVDLRTFVHLRDTGSGVDAVVAPAALTRVAPSGSLVVNSSRGGGGKDTWILGATNPESA